MVILGGGANRGIDERANLSESFERNASNGEISRDKNTGKEWEERRGVGRMERMERRREEQARKGEASRVVRGGKSVSL